MLFALRTLFFFFFNDTATTEIYTLSLHDALPISPRAKWFFHGARDFRNYRRCTSPGREVACTSRSEEHTSELQSPDHLVCRLLLEKKKKKTKYLHPDIAVSRPRIYKRTHAYSICH